MLATLRPLGIASMVGLIAYMINPSWMAWSAVSLPAWLRWLGVGVGAVAGSLFIWTMHTLGKNLTDTVVTRRAHELVTTGPYRFVRHPFYCTFVLAVLANSAVAANWFILLTGGSAWLVIVFRTKKEEENLIARFGDDYPATWNAPAGSFRGCEAVASPCWPSLSPYAAIRSHCLLAASWRGELGVGVRAHLPA